MRIPETFRKCVVFLGRIGTDGRGEEYPHFGGTGFIVSVPGPLCADRHYLYLVTAKHVVDRLAGSEWIVRANAADGQIQNFKASPRRKWWFHPSEEDVTDVAVTNFEGSNKLDYTIVPVQSFLDDSQISDNGIGAGDDVFMVGLFTKMQGQQKMLPLVRMGNVAMIPSPGERVPAVNIGSNIVEAEAVMHHLK